MIAALGNTSFPQHLLGDKTIITLTLIHIFISCLGFGVELPWLSLFLPIGITGIYLIIFRIKWIYYLLFFFIPLSMEFEVPGGLGTDLPGEPILWLLSIISIFIIAYKNLPRVFFSRLTILLVLHLAWIFFTGIFAEIPLISFKYALAKTWYFLPFYVLPFLIFTDSSEIRTLLKFFVLGVFLASLYFFIQHWQLDMSYATRTNAGQPIWRNHVNYACTLVISLPMLWYLYISSRHPDRWVYIAGALLFLVFIYFAYARIAYLSMFTVVIYLFIVRYKLTKLIITAALLAAMVLILWLRSDNHFLHLAPQYNKTITQIDFEGKISATTMGEDISTMERVHRWVAGTNMIKDRPLTGFGPANFYNSYLPYTIFSFETYVSNNPEHSGIHNYFLMLLVEQGYIGFFLFLCIIIYALVTIEKIYHSTNIREYKNLLLLSGMILIMIITINLVNDMIEVIKIGSIFFLLLFVLQKIRLGQLNVR